MTDTTVTTTAYLVVQGDRRKWGATNKDTGLRPIEGARVLAIRQNRPSGLTADQVAVRVRLVMPAAIFDPQAPVATITVPAELVQHPVMEGSAVGRWTPWIPTPAKWCCRPGTNGA